MRLGTRADRDEAKPDIEPQPIIGAVSFSLEPQRRSGHRRHAVASHGRADSNDSLEERLWTDASVCAARTRFAGPASGAKATWDDLQLPPVDKALVCGRSRPGARSAQVYERVGLRRTKMSRGLGISALFAGESGTGKTMAAEVLAQRAAARPLPHRSLRRRQQIHRRDREEPAAAVRRRRGRRRDPALRRGRRAVRQAQRGQGQPRPLRQHRGQLSAAAHGGVSRAGDPRPPT